MNRSTATKEEFPKEEVSAHYDMLVFGKEEEKLKYSLSKCCNPIPGDPVFGFITIKDGIKVHKHNCPNAVSMQSQYAYRVISAKWIDSSRQGFKATIEITGVDTIGLVNEVTRVISSNLSVNIHSLNISGQEGFFHGIITVHIKNNQQLTNLMVKLQKIDGIENVKRNTN